MKTSVLNKKEMSETFSDCLGEYLDCVAEGYSTIAAATEKFLLKAQEIDPSLIHPAAKQRLEYFEKKLAECKSDKSGEKTKKPNKEKKESKLENSTEKQKGSETADTNSSEHHHHKHRKHSQNSQ